MQTNKKNIQALCPTIEQNFTIHFNYNIYFTYNLFNKKNKLIYSIINNKNRKNNILIIIDKKVLEKHINLKKEIQDYFQKYKNTINLTCCPIVISGGEFIKNHYMIVKYIYKKINDYKICRQSFIIAIGGGTILDLSGFIAGTAHRGIKLIRIPTTTLSQDDSGVGVKNGINFLNKKNFIGTFAIPFAVINDYKLLTSLDSQKWIAGISEAIKVALIKDKKFFLFIMKNTKVIISRNRNIMQKIIYQCAKLHAEHISQKGDPFECLSSRPLDFGHWSAHKLESMTKYKLSHGESVAIGIALDCTYSYLLKILDKNEWKKIIKTLVNLNFKIYAPELLNKIKKTYLIFKGLSEFREHLGGKLTITLLKKIGYGIDIHHVNLNIYIKSIKILKKYNSFIKKYIK